MIKAIPLILTTCMVGEAGWTIQIKLPQQSDLAPIFDSVIEADEFVTEDVETEYEATDDGWEYLGEIRVTGYTWTGNPCASGVYPYEGCCANNALPIGTVVYIEGLGYYTVEDRGGMTGYWTDIYFDTLEECYQVTGYYEAWIVH